MIRQHFYPKAYFRHKSLGKNYSKLDIETKQNSSFKLLNQIDGNQIKFIKKKHFLHQTQQNDSCHLDTLEKQYRTSDLKNNKTTKDIQQQTKKQISSQLTVLRQIHSTNRENSQQKHQNSQNQINGLFIQSNRKEIVQTNKNSYRALCLNNQENSNTIVENACKNGKKKKSMRKLCSADNSYRTYKRSVQGKKKQQQTPSQLIINSTVSTMEVNNHFSSSQRSKPPKFQQISDNLINMNLSKALKYRQSGMQQKFQRSRKTWQKISLSSIQNRNYDFQQKVRGWEIQIEDDIEFS